LNLKSVFRMYSKTLFVVHILYICGREFYFIQALARKSAKYTLDYKTSTAEKCIIYDKPERTGSDTAALVLHRCVLGKGYKSIVIPHQEYKLKPERYNRKRAVKLFLDQAGSRIALVRRLLHLSRHDILALRKNVQIRFSLLLQLLWTIGFYRGLNMTEKGAFRKEIFLTQCKWS